eukprot:5565660-Pleurochrysis_carterae.AAC.1
MADSYAPMVAAFSCLPAFFACLEPRLRMYSTNIIIVASLYWLPPSASGSRNGCRPVSARKSAHHSSAVARWRLSFASCTLV